MTGIQAQNAFDQVALEGFSCRTASCGTKMCTGDVLPRHWIDCLDSVKVLTKRGSQILYAVRAGTLFVGTSYG